MLSGLMSLKRDTENTVKLIFGYHKSESDLCLCRYAAQFVEEAWLGFSNPKIIKIIKKKKQCFLNKQWIKVLITCWTDTLENDYDARDPIRRMKAYKFQMHQNHNYKNAFTFTLNILSN